ncbi:MAG: Asp-tRNA(Asn)/Glu-tRNA(Gln) amidotransferase subunit GatB [Armatimonadetes bacterium]|nr:Asp-tRNA(Asn)/Glu-tRNA(Gln) amidotransferase subunit GatB [Armatimonadota bacterium]MDI9583536.1 Asp-tRNA(Asn)/Glu-tRNA(Gln) amidotransferase subunit GatB [Acidobacteriota bacterium]
MALTPVIGVEVHVELLTDSKMFCGCRNEFGGEANSRCCPVCIGLPGSLPVANRDAVGLTILAGLALNCKVLDLARFYRKNYFYPDLCKNYQISQYDEPLTYDGEIHLNVDGEPVSIGIARAHLEEDTGKNLHLPDGRTLVDYNRCGVPLMEVVTKPDFRSAEQVREYLLQLRRLLRYLGVSTANMEEGAMRAEANVNFIDFETGQKTPVIEVKNIGSITNCYNAIRYEIERQRKEIADGTLPAHRETRRWDETRNITSPMRQKESADDYMYFPEPDLVPMAPEVEWVEEIRASMPELPWDRERRFVEDLGLPQYDAGVLCETRAIADYFEAVAGSCSDAKLASNWVMGNVMATLNERGIGIEDFPVPAEQIAALIGAVCDGTISNNIAKDVYAKMLETGDAPATIIEREGLRQISDTGELEALIQAAIEANPRAVEDFRAGKGKALGAIVGFVMRETKGQANPQLVNDLLIKALGG